MKIEKGTETTRENLIRKAIALYFERTTNELQPGKVRVISNTVEIMPVNEEVIYRISFDRSTVSNIARINALTRAIEDASVDAFFLFPAKHFVSDKEAQKEAVTSIEQELKERLAELNRQGKVLEYERLRRRTSQDLALIKEIGYCNGMKITHDTLIVAQQAPHHTHCFHISQKTQTVNPTS